MVWQVAQDETAFEVNVPADPAPGRYSLNLSLDNEPAYSVQHITHTHIAPRALVRPAQVAVQVIDVALPDVRVGYVGGGNDRVDHWMAAMGLDVTKLSDTDLQSDAALAQFDSIVIGIFALKFRAGLAAQMPRLHRWCAAGGTLVTLYHRPWDNWDAATTAPKRWKLASRLCAGG